jgi:hypothetical protein
MAGIVSKEAQFVTQALIGQGYMESFACKDKSCCTTTRPPPITSLHWRPRDSLSVPHPSLHCICSINAASSPLPALALPAVAQPRSTTPPTRSSPSPALLPFGSPLSHSIGRQSLARAWEATTGSCAGGCCRLVSGRLPPVRAQEAVVGVSSVDRRAAGVTVG